MRQMGEAMYETLMLLAPYQVREVMAAKIQDAIERGDASYAGIAMTDLVRLVQAQRGEHSLEAVACETCGSMEMLGVCSMPGLPVSVSYCVGCYRENAHPWRLLVAQAALCDGRENMDAEFQEMVECTLRRLGRTRAEFDDAVTAAMRALEQRLPVDTDGLPADGCSF